MEVYVKCESKEKSYIFMRKMSSMNISWSDRRKCTANTSQWNDYETQTVYYISTGMKLQYSNAKYAEENEYKEMSYDELMSCRDFNELKRRIERLF